MFGWNKLEVHKKVGFSNALSMQMHHCAIYKGQTTWKNDVALHVTLESGTLKFVESFTLSEMDEIDITLGDMFFSQGRYKAQTTISCGVLWWQRNGFEVTKNSYGGRNNFNLIWMDQIKKWTSGGGCSNGGTLRNSHGGYELRASPKAHSQDDWEGTTMHSPMSHLRNYRKKKK